VTDDERDALKQQIAEIFEIGPDEMWLLEPTIEEVQLKAEREQWAAAVRLGALLPPGMTWVVE
jgi:hypothetical protein